MTSIGVRIAVCCIVSCRSMCCSAWHSPIVRMRREGVCNAVSCCVLMCVALCVSVCFAVRGTHSFFSCRAVVCVLLQWLAACIAMHGTHALFSRAVLGADAKCDACVAARVAARVAVCCIAWCSVLHYVLQYILQYIALTHQSHARRWEQTPSAKHAMQYVLQCVLHCALQYMALTHCSHARRWEQTPSTTQAHRQAASSYQTRALDALHGR